MVEYKHLRIREETAKRLLNYQIAMESYDTIINNVLNEVESLRQDKKDLLKALQS